MKEHKFEKKTWDDVKSNYSDISYWYMCTPFVCSDCGYISVRDSRTYTPKSKDIQDCNEALVWMVHES